MSGYALSDVTKDIRTKEQEIRSGKLDSEERLLVRKELTQLRKQQTLLLKARGKQWSWSQHSKHHQALDHALRTLPSAPGSAGHCSTLPLVSDKRRALLSSPGVTCALCPQCWRHHRALGSSRWSAFERCLQLWPPSAGFTGTKS